MTDADRATVEYVSPDGRYRHEHYLSSDGIVYAVSSGYEDEESARATLAAFQETYAKSGRRFAMCMDVSDLDQITPEARRVWNRFAFCAESVFESVALYGGNLFVGVLLNLYARVASIPVRHTKTRAQAVEWLETRKP